MRLRIVRLGCNIDVMQTHQVSLPSQLVLINMSLAINDALMHIPNFYVFWNLGSIVSGAIFYHVRRTLIVALSSKIE